MPNTSPNLALPYLLPSQAQKHVTHNEALARLDQIVQLVVQGFDGLIPPASPGVGEIHALGAAPEGVWTGQGGRLAAWDGTTWAFVPPRDGWRAWGRTEGELRIWRGTAWERLPLDNLAGLGVNTTHDATNRLAVAAAATLLTHAGAGHQVKVNKAASGDTASLLFQDNWSGRAEMGLVGGDDFSVKVSPDGLTWSEALLADHATGRVSLPAGAVLGDGAAATPALGFGAAPTTGLFRSATGQIGFAVAGIARALMGGSAFQLDLPLTGTAITQSATDATAGRLMRTGDFGTGTVGAPTVAANLDDGTLASGLYLLHPTNTTAGTWPPGMAATYATLDVQRISTVAFVETLTPLVTSKGRWTRSYNSGGWTAWVQDTPVVGAVSQSSGVPTGAVIERASNANGEYARFADGTQICISPGLTSGAVNVASGALYTCNFSVWSFPAAFVTGSYPVVHGECKNSVGWVVTNTHSTTSVSAGLMRTASAAGGFDYILTAIGRWF
ncbi:Protein of unknown function [Gemmobacter aquatilis]|uniref:DUF2793 domain-containing protein n=1 Tax=Gemmobacter aquatilis TaxID=933059 RepID=A0A1H8N2W9_9RHOB|nr:DUF2793 domain-containing protein [Gemmobacter aquatilis]SEO23859.1 Protein of unknown function [Gemmobacter aquatilis]